MSKTKLIAILAISVIAIGLTNTAQAKEAFLTFDDFCGIKTHDDRIGREADWICQLIPALQEQVNTVESDVDVLKTDVHHLQGISHEQIDVQPIYQEIFDVRQLIPEPVDISHLEELAHEKVDLTNIETSIGTLETTVEKLEKDSHNPVSIYKKNGHVTVTPGTVGSQVLDCDAGDSIMSGGYDTEYLLGIMQSQSIGDGS